MSTFTLTATNANAVGEDLEKMGKRATELRPIFNPLIAAIMAGEKQLFKRNGGGGKNRWPMNTKSTLARKIARGQGQEVMRATGFTRLALTRRGAPGQIVSGGGTQLIFGVHSVGAWVARWEKNPERRRDVVQMPVKTRATVRQIVLDHIVEGG